MRRNNIRRRKNKAKKLFIKAGLAEHKLNIFVALIESLPMSFITLENQLQQRIKYIWHLYHRAKLMQLIQISVQACKWEFFPELVC